MLPVLHHAVATPPILNNAAQCFLRLMVFSYLYLSLRFYSLLITCSAYMECDWSILFEKIPIMYVYLSMCNRKQAFLIRCVASFQSVLPSSMSEFQRLRCRVAFHSLQFRQGLRELGHRMVERYESSNQSPAQHNGSGELGILLKVNAPKIHEFSQNSSFIPKVFKIPK